MNHGNNRIVLPTVTQAGSVVVASITTFAKRNRVITGSYLFGVLILLFAGSGYQLSRQQSREFSRIMSTIDVEAEYDASLQYANAEYAYQASKGWFFSCDSLCQRNKARMEKAKANLDAIRAEGHNRMSDAKSIAGIFSEVGVSEVKDKFWEIFHSGKQFAKRMSMWDAMFMGIRSMGRDESFVQYCVKVLIQVLLNFSMGLIMALVMFVLSLWAIVRSYQPDPITAVTFFICATCAAFAFVSTYLFMVYGAAAGALFGVAKMVEANGRLENGGPGGARRRNVYDRPYYR